MAKHSIMLLPLFVLFSGCGPTIYPASGKVVYNDDSPVKQGGIVLQPTAGSPFQVRGEIKNDGTFDLYTIDENGSRRLGAPPGEYQVYLLPGAAENKGEGGQEPIEIAAEKFGDPSRSGIVITIKSENNKDLKVQVEKPGR